MEIGSSGGMLRAWDVEARGGVEVWSSRAQRCAAGVLDVEV